MQAVGLRERKKLDTLKALGVAARALALEAGLENVTVEQITERVGVSTRTFFNYFPSKEAAMVGIDPAVLDDLRERLLARPATEGPLEALRQVIVGDGGTAAATNALQRSELVRRYPNLLPRYLETMASVERALADALAERLDDRGVHATVVVGAVFGAIRQTIAWCEERGRINEVDALLTSAFDQLAAGLAAPKEPSR